MEISDYEVIRETSRRRVRETSLDIKRFLAGEIDWRDRLICLKGARGTGKTTMLLQHIKECFADDPDTALYVSLDNLWFETHSLIDLADYHYKNGGTHIFCDEVHYLRDWQLIIKNLYDDYPNLHICYTGSSLLKIDAKSGDLSRRQIVYILPGLSFREYLHFEGLGVFERVTLEELIKNHIKFANELVGRIKVLKYFSKYLRSGYYPFYRDVYAGYEVRLSQTINQILESDYPALESINYSTVSKIKKMLYILAQSCPQTPNMSKLYRELETDRNQGIKMLSVLDRACLLNLFSDENATLKNMTRPYKIYCDNTNIMYALTEHIDTGTKRETFFLNQLKSAGNLLTYPSKGDFIVNGRYLFEIGGQHKSFDQIKDIPDSFLAIDDIEVGYGNKIPLWMFGMLY